MKKNLYFKAVFGRTNIFREIFLITMVIVGSFPRLIIEVFIRKNFGERHFNLLSGLTLFALLIVPFIMFVDAAVFRDYLRQSPFKEFNWTWGAFALAYGYFMLKRAREMNYNPSVYDFEKMSCYSGDIHPVFNQPKFFGLKSNPVRRDTIFEPLPFLILGIVFLTVPFTKMLGLLLTFCAAIYGLSSYALYLISRDNTLNKIDQMIANEQMKDVFVNDKPERDAKGFRWIGPKPNTKEQREKLLPYFFEGEPEDFEVN